MSSEFMKHVPNSNLSKDSLQTQEKLPVERSFTCTYDGCQKSYTCSSHLKRHENTHDGHYRCTEPKCGLILKTKSTLKKHIDNVHLKKKSKKYKCQDCGEEFNKHNWLTSHRYKHTGVKPYECSVEGCDKTFLYPTKLKAHMKHHQGYTCTKENCGEHFPKWTLYRNHLKVCHPRVFTCHYCEKKFSRSNNLKEHLRVHNLVEEVFLCPKDGCSRFYLRERTLSDHLKSYHEKRPFACTKEHCPKTFKSKADLNAHLARHVSPKRKKHKKPKPSFSAELAGCAPKKWQIELIEKQRTNVSDAKLSEDHTKSKGNKIETQLNTTEVYEEVLQFISRKDEDVTVITSDEEKNITIDVENNNCSISRDIKELLNMVKKEQVFNTEEKAQNAKCISAVA